MKFKINYTDCSTDYYIYDNNSYMGLIVKWYNTKHLKNFTAIRRDNGTPCHFYTMQDAFKYVKS